MVVVNYIENNMDVGTIDQPKTYFKGSLPMSWGPLCGMDMKKVKI